jgi:hypothetical protein
MLPLALDLLLLVLLLFSTLLLCRGCVNRTRNTLGAFIDVEVLVDGLWDGLNLSPQFLLDLVEVESIVPIDEIDSKTEMTESTGSTNSMEVRLGIFGEIKVDNNVDSLNIDTTSEKIRANEVAANTIPKVVKDSIAVVL